MSVNPPVQERRLKERRTDTDRRWVQEIIGDRRRVCFPFDVERRNGLDRRGEERRLTHNRRGSLPQGDGTP